MIDIAFIPTNDYKRGDVNMGSNIDISDVIWVLKHIVGIIALDNKQCSYTDGIRLFYPCTLKINREESS